jgi:hypothetical protein
MCGMSTAARQPIDVTLGLAYNAFLGIVATGTPPSPQRWSSVCDIAQVDGRGATVGARRTTHAARYEASASQAVHNSAPRSV